MYIFNAILLYSEKKSLYEVKRAKLGTVIRAVYPKELAEKINLEMIKLKILVQTQINNYNDRIGASVDLEDGLFKEDEII